jgi:lipopolysaccharide biosynthesis glycosyltransferase
VRKAHALIVRGRRFGTVVKQILHVAAACDESYAMPLAVMISSLAANLSMSRSACVHVLQRHLPTSLRTKVEESVHRDTVRINWIDIDANRLPSLENTLRSFDTVTLESYYRLLLPDVLPQDLDKVIYLDSDLVVHHDLSKLWDLNVENTCLLAVAELSPASGCVSSPAGIRLYRELKLPSKQKIFNSGVMLINLRKWRHEQVSARAFIYLEAARQYLRWHDQEALNVVLAGDWDELDSRWNVTMHAVRTSADTRRHADLIQNPYIIHFNSARKPWQTDFSLGFQNLFYHYLDTTAWKDWRPDTTSSMTKRIARVIRRAAQKRIHNASTQLRLASSKLSNWSAVHVLPEKVDLNSFATGIAREIRAFINVVDPGVSLLQTMTYYRNIGVDRIFLLVDKDIVSEARNLSGTDKHLHVFTYNKHRKMTMHSKIRALLGRYGNGHWCVLVDNNEMLYFPHSDTISLKQLCNFIDESGSDAMNFRVLNSLPERIGRSPSIDQTQRVNLTGHGPDDLILLRDQRHCVKVKAVARDPVTGHVFTTPLLLEDIQEDGDPSIRYCSKVALLKFRHGMGMDQHIMAVDGARLADARGALLRYTGSCIAAQSSISHYSSTQLLDAGIMQSSAALEELSSNFARS